MTVPSWPGSPEWPDQPGYPYPPARPIPRREGPVMVPIVDLPRGDAVEQLRARRRVLLTGPIDSEGATKICAELMALDGQSGDDVELFVNSDGGPLAAVLAVLDVIGSMRARLHTRCLGRATGTATVVLACGTGERTASPHSVISLRAGEERIEGPPERLRAEVAQLEVVRRSGRGGGGGPLGPADRRDRCRAGERCHPRRRAGEGARPRRRCGRTAALTVTPARRGTPGSRGRPPQCRRRASRR